MRYRTIVADPPWPYSSSDGSAIPQGNHQSPLSGPGMTKRYGAMSMDDILALCPPADDAAHLYLWTTNAFMVEAHDVARAWGFKTKTICTWVKTHQTDSTRASMKTGYYFRGATEHFLFGVRGVLPLQNHSLPTAYLWPRLPRYWTLEDDGLARSWRSERLVDPRSALRVRRVAPNAHSVKPDAFYDLVETASPGPYLELFARRQRFGWDTWGNEALNHVEMSA